MAFLDIEHLHKQFATLNAVADFNLQVKKGEFISLLGSSGCGKTTALRMIAGFEPPTGGKIILDGQEFTRKAANQRHIGMVFQSYALFPNMTVADNIGFGLKIKKQAPDKVRDRVAELLHLIQLPDKGASYPYQLSGGQQQRVALARALAIEPQVLLLDEPLSALDAKTRVELRQEIRNIQQQLNMTTIYVTHDQEEALSLSDRIVVMNKGVIEQVGTPFAIYNYPTSAFTASFVGQLNVLTVIVTDGVNGQCQFEDFGLGCNPNVDATSPAYEGHLWARIPDTAPDSIASLTRLGFHREIGLPSRCATHCNGNRDSAHPALWLCCAGSWVEETEWEARVNLHRDVWHPSRVTLDAYQRLRGVPGYDPELDLVVVAPDGEMAAYCICWWDEVNRTGEFEPVGTREKWRGRGLGKIVIAEGLRRLQARGAHTAYVSTPGSNTAAQRLYESVGFTTYTREYLYGRTL